MRCWCATNHGGILLPPKAASRWVTAGQCCFPKPLPSRVSLTQGELWKDFSHCQFVVPFLASFDFHFLFPCSLCASLFAAASHAFTPCLLHAMLSGTGCISSSAWPSYRKAFEIWGLKDEEGSVCPQTRPFALHLQHVLVSPGSSWATANALVILQLWDSRSPCLPFGVCHHILFLFPLRRLLWAN